MGHMFCQNNIYSSENSLLFFKQVRNSFCSNKRALPTTFYEMICELSAKRSTNLKKIPANFFEDLVCTNKLEAFFHEILFLGVGAFFTYAKPLT